MSRRRRWGVITIRSHSAMEGPKPLPSRACQVGVERLQPIQNRKSTMWTPLFWIALSALGTAPVDRATVLIVVGASGTPEYASEFRRSADRWTAAASSAG